MFRYLENLRKKKKAAVPDKEISSVVKEPAASITEAEEKSVAFDEKLPDPHRYFVIIDSFRIQANEKHHTQVKPA